MGRLRYLYFFSHTKRMERGHQSWRKINTDQWESQPCLSPDKRDLYFASKRFGGHGGSDIYVSHLRLMVHGVILKILDRQ
jgi:hypothetical protein